MRETKKEEEEEEERKRPSVFCFRPLVFAVKAKAPTDENEKRGPRGPREKKKTVKGRTNEIALLVPPRFRASVRPSVRFPFPLTLFSKNCMARVPSSGLTIYCFGLRPHVLRSKDRGRERKEGREG